MTNSSLDDDNEINEIANKLIIEDYNVNHEKSLFEVIIRPNKKDGIKEYSGSVKVTFYGSKILNDNHNFEDHKSNLAFLCDSFIATRISMPNDFKEETILSIISKIKTNDNSICEGKPIDISKINIKLAKNKLSVMVEPKNIDNQIYNGVVRFWFAKNQWNQLAH